VRPIPIFDTNLFGHAQSGKISPSEWRFLLRHRPGRGWPLSAVTALELLVDLDNATEETFLNFRERIDFALRVSNGRILEEPRLLICRDVLHVPFPAHIPRLPVEVLSAHMHVIRRARSLKQLREGRIPWKSGYARLEATDALKNVVEGVKKQWIRQVEDFADNVFPHWRTCFEKTGRRLPPEMRKNVDRKSMFEMRSMGFVEGLLSWLKAKKEPEVLSDVRKRLDSVLRFTAFVVDQFLERNYSLEKHSSDVFDQFQLHYLALDRFTIVSEDTDMWKRTAESPQASRIMSFETFLESLH